MTNQNFTDEIDKAASLAARDVAHAFSRRSRSTPDPKSPGWMDTAYQAQIAVSADRIIAAHPDWPEPNSEGPTGTVRRQVEEALQRHVSIEFRGLLLRSYGKLHNRAIAVLVLAVIANIGYQQSGHVVFLLIALALVSLLIAFTTAIVRTGSSL